MTASADEPGAARLIAFVGQKVKVEQFEPPACNPQPQPGMQAICIRMDLAFHAEYRVLKQVYGKYDDAVIRFDAFDHYGWPAFASYEHVLLFVSRSDDGQWYHQKYQFFPVYETTDGGWAACGSANDHPTKPGPSTARPLSFKRPVVMPLMDVKPEEADEWFPPPVWARVQGFAVCRHGTPVAELFEAKKRGVLKARGLFD